MKILQISTYDIRGGAARAAYRLHSGLLEIGEDSRMVVRFRSSKDSRVFPVVPGQKTEDRLTPFAIGEAIQKYCINVHRTDLSNTLFSFPYPGYDISGSDLVRTADVINLHWISFFLSPVTLKRLFDLGRPVVWTLHDQRPFTGGCHYSAGCVGYCEKCAVCPQLADNPFDLPEVFLKDKSELFKDANLTIVTPSRWMADCAMESRLFKGRRIEVIPNSLDTEFYRPIEKMAAKRDLGIANGTVVILFCAESGSERRKGLRELIGALEYCQTKSSFQSLIRNHKVKLFCLGHIDHTLDSLGIPVVAPGYMNSDEEIRMAYRASDIFVQPSLEDNFPNAVLEAMGCGIPIVAFKVGGIPEMAADGITGIIVPSGDVRAMGEAILSLVLDPEKRNIMGSEARKKMVRKFSLARQAGCYDELYQNLHHEHKLHFQGTHNDLTRESTQSKTLTVKIDMSTGAYFKDSFVQILLMTMGKLQSALMESEADREARLGRIEELTAELEESNRDRALRLDQVNELARLLKESEADREARLGRIEELTAELEEMAGRTRSAEEGWRSLEASFAVRYGRKMGLIKNRKLDVSASQAENDAKKQKKSLD